MSHYYKDMALSTKHGFYYFIRMEGSTFTVTCAAYVLSQVTITTFNRAITSFTVPKFVVSQSEAVSTVLIYKQ